MGQIKHIFEGFCIESDSAVISKHFFLVTGPLLWEETLLYRI